jgi:ribosomal protein L1
MSKHHRSKRYRACLDLVEVNKAYSLEEAVTTLKKLPPTKFDQTVTLSFRLGVDPRQSDQMVRGTCPLPHGSGKVVRVLVFAQGQPAQAAREAGAEYVGFEDLIKKIQDGFQDFDVAIATPAAMSEVRKLGKILGPRGLMPNPKAGTVTEDTVKARQERQRGCARGESLLRAASVGREWHRGNRRSGQGKAARRQRQVRSQHHGECHDDAWSPDRRGTLRQITEI